MVIGPHGETRPSDTIVHVAKLATGEARTESLTPERRREIAQARWRKAG